MPSALRVSKAYSISFSVTSTFIIDSGAKTPKRPGWSWRILAAKSWQIADGLGGFVGAGVEPEAGRGGKRHHRGADAVLVHQLDQPGWRPVDHRLERRDVALALPFQLLGEVGRRIEVAVRVDQRLGGLRAQTPARAASRPRRRRRGRPGTGGGTNVLARKRDNCGTASVSSLSFSFRPVRPDWRDDSGFVRATERVDGGRTAWPIGPR